MPRKITFGDVLDSPTIQEGNLGELAELPDGRLFRFIQFNEAFAQGQLGAALANDAITNITATSANSQSQTVFIEETGAGWTVGQYANAWGLVTGGTGVGQIFKIKNNTSITLELYPDYRIRTALDTTSDLTLVRKHRLRLSPAALLGEVTGFFQGFAATVAADFGFVQVDGIGAVLADGTGGVAGEYLGPSNATAGSVETMGAGETIDDVSIVGRFIAGNVSEVNLANIHVV